MLSGGGRSAMPSASRDSTSAEPPSGIDAVLWSPSGTATVLKDPGNAGTARAPSPSTTPDRASAATTCHAQPGNTGSIIHRRGAVVADGESDGPRQDPGAELAATPRPSASTTPAASSGRERSATAATGFLPADARRWRGDASDHYDVAVSLHDHLGQFQPSGGSCPLIDADRQRAEPVACDGGADRPPG